MKVVTDYCDGVFYMRPAEERQAWMDDRDWNYYSRGIIEISEEEYKRYEEFLDQSRFWNVRIRDLDNLAHERLDQPTPKT
jgi:hypothetical protein